MEKERIILHCDLNNFYASVECKLNPSLKNTPMAVGGSVETRTVLNIAKGFGVMTAETIWQANKKCKDLIIVPPHFEEYEKYSRPTRDIYE